MLHVRVRGLLLAVAVLVSVVLAADSDAQPDSSDLGTTPASSNQGQGIGDPREGPKYASGDAAAKMSNPKVPKADQRKSRRNKKSWLSMMGLGGTDKDGKPKTFQLPKLSTEEVLTGVFVIAIGGLFLSFNI